MVFTLAANTALFGSLVFGLFFLWVSAPNWPPTRMIELGLTMPAMIVAALAAAFVSARLAIRAVQGEGSPMVWLVLMAIGHVVALTGLGQLGFAIPEPAGHAHSATGLVIILYLVLHAGIGLIFACWSVFRWFEGYIGPRRLVDLRIGGLWHLYTLVAGVAGLAAIYTVTWLAQGRPTMPW
jgi:cytochrome c oxidase subunit I+III